jgi:hypothetical protein
VLRDRMSMDNVRRGITTLRGVVGAVGVAAVLMLSAGCGSSDNPGSPTATGSTGADDPKAAAVQFAECMRKNGSPNFPDPIRDENGDWSFPPSVGKPVAPPACESAFQKMRTVNQRHAEASSNADPQKLRAFAKCMRQQGLADWPDPTPEGAFPLPGRYAPPDGESLIAAPLRACPHDGITIQLPRFNNDNK